MTEETYKRAELQVVVYELLKEHEYPKVKQVVEGGFEQGLFVKSTFATLDEILISLFDFIPQY